MRAVNHALTGGVVTAAIGSPWALPLAFCSHFVLDALPHFDDKQRAPLGSKAFWIILGIDTALVLSLVAVIALSMQNAWLVIAGMLLALSPDIVHINKLLPDKFFPQGRVYRMHERIQWSETPAGVFVEAIWLLAMGYVLFGGLYG